MLPHTKIKTLPKRAGFHHLVLILKLQIVQRHDVAVPDAHGLQLVKQAGLAQVLVEPVAGLVVAEVDVGQTITRNI